VYVSITVGLFKQCSECTSLTEDSWC